MAIRDIDDLFITLPDQTRLAARLWCPEGATPVPAILEFIPYRKRDNTLPRDETIHPWMAAQGYACLRVDIRGHGDSEGVFDDEYSAQELQDACDVIAWIAAQDWCSGAVGMMGKSWGAFNCLQVAALNPPALKAVVKVCGTVDRFNDDIHYKGGCLLGENFAWGSLMLSYTARPADPLLRDDWREDFRQRIAQMPHLSEIWSSHQSRDAYWKHGSVCEDYSAVQAAVLSVGGWNDNYMNAPAALVENATNAKAIVGPWVHQYPHTAVPGPQIDFLSEMKRWWDHWLKGDENGVSALPGYRAYMLDSARPDASAAHRPGRWVAVDQPMSATERYPLEVSSPKEIATPQTLGAASGEFFPMGLNAEMAADQRFDDAQSVCFDWDCAEGLTLLGAAELDLQISCDQSHGFVVARLCDVAPDGASTRIAHGMLNLHHRVDPPAPVTPGEVMPLSLRLDQMAYQLAPGHKLRLALSNSYWPFVWPSPHAAKLSLMAGELRLPVPNGPLEACHFDAPPPVAAPRLRQLSEGKETKRREIDEINGDEVIEITSDSGVTENPDHGLQTRSTMVETWRIHRDDPLCASCSIHWTQDFQRRDWKVHVTVNAKQFGTAEALELSAKVTACIEETGMEPETIERNFVAEIERDHI